jgi:hypothetical protein
MKRIITAVCLVLGLAASAWAQGLRYPLIDWRFVNGGNLPQTQAVYMNEDTISIKVESGDRPQPRTGRYGDRAYFQC